MKHFAKLIAGLLAITLLAGCSSSTTTTTMETTASETSSDAAITANADSSVTLAPYRWVEGWDPHKDWNGINSSRFLVCEGLVTL